MLRQKRKFSNFLRQEKEVEYDSLLSDECDQDQENLENHEPLTTTTSRKAVASTCTSSGHDASLLDATRKGERLFLSPKSVRESASKGGYSITPVSLTRSREANKTFMKNTSM